MLGARRIRPHDPDIDQRAGDYYTQAPLDGGAHVGVHEEPAEPAGGR